MGERVALPGERNGNAVITWEIARFIRNSSDSGASLGRQFGISRTVANMIKRGVAWKEPI